MNEPVSFGRINRMPQHFHCVTVERVNPIQADLEHGNLMALVCSCYT
jgi:hypothetical protein